MRYNTKNQELKQIKKEYGQRDNRLGLFVERRTKERRKEGSRTQEAGRRKEAVQKERILHPSLLPLPLPCPSLSPFPISLPSLPEWIYT